MITQVLGWGRRQAESRFTETFVFFTTVETTDPETFEPGTVETVLATVPGRLKASTTQGREVESGAQFPVVSRLEVHVAVGAVDAAPGVFVRVSASTVDASLVGRVYRVADRPESGQVTAHRFPVEEVS